MRFKTSNLKEAKHTDLVSCVGWGSPDDVISAGDDSKIYRLSHWSFFTRRSFNHSFPIPISSSIIIRIEMLDHRLYAKLWLLKALKIGNNFDYKNRYSLFRININIFRWNLVTTETHLLAELPADFHPTDMQWFPTSQGILKQKPL